MKTLVDDQGVIHIQRSEDEPGRSKCLFKLNKTAQLSGEICTACLELVAKRTFHCVDVTVGDWGGIARFDVKCPVCSSEVEVPLDEWMGDGDFYHSHTILCVNGHRFRACVSLNAYAVVV